MSTNVVNKDALDTFSDGSAKANHLLQRMHTFKQDSSTIDNEMRATEIKLGFGTTMNKFSKVDKDPSIEQNKSNY